MKIEEQIKMVREDWSSIRYIKNPYLEVQLAAVNNCGRAISFISNPCLEVKMATVKENPSMFLYFSKDEQTSIVKSFIKENYSICFETLAKFDRMRSGRYRKGRNSEALVRRLYTEILAEIELEKDFASE
jgi:hypothetical protein